MVETGDLLHRRRRHRHGDRQPAADDGRRSTASEQRRQVAAGRRCSTRCATCRRAPSDDVDIRLLANIDGPDELDGALDYGAMGVGLFRTEYLFMTGDRAARRGDALPDRASRCSSSSAGRPATIRTFDLGADKLAPLPRGRRPRRGNPALGLRSIRLCLSPTRRGRCSSTQLRGLLRASAHGPLKHHVPDDLRASPSCARSRSSSTRSRRELARRGHRVRRRRQARHHDRDAVGGADRRPPGRSECRLLLDRHQRPHPVHDGGRPRERVRVVPLRAAAPGAAAPDRRASRRRRRPRTSRSRCAARWPASR